MARVNKDNIDFIQLPCGFFKDKRVKQLRRNFGNKGTAIYLCILAEIGSDKGYYTELDDDLVYDVSDTLGVSEGLVREVIKYLLDRAMLKSILVKSVNYVTSADSQAWFQAAKTKTGAKRDILVDGQIWLLKKPETAGFIKVRPNENNSMEKKNNSMEKKNNSMEESASKVKISKDKLSKDKSYSGSDEPDAPPKRSKRFTPPSVEEVKAYCEGRRNGINAEAFIDYYASRGWKLGKETMKDWKACVRTWEHRQGYTPPKEAPEATKQTAHKAYDLDAWYQQANDFYNMLDDMYKEDEK